MQRGHCSAGAAPGRGCALVDGEPLAAEFSFGGPGHRGHVPAAAEDADRPRRWGSSAAIEGRHGNRASTAVRRLVLAKRRRGRVRWRHPRRQLGGGSAPRGESIRDSKGSASNPRDARHILVGQLARTATASRRRAIENRERRLDRVDRLQLLPGGALACRQARGCGASYDDVRGRGRRAECRGARRRTGRRCGSAASAGPVTRVELADANKSKARGVEDISPEPRRARRAYNLHRKFSAKLKRALRESVAR
jgi:hypothetical protein